MTTTLLLSRQRPPRRAAGPAVVAILLALGANLALFALLGWINRRAVATADRRIIAARQVELIKPPRRLPALKPPQPPRPRPKPPQPQKQLTVARQEPAVEPRTIPPLPMRTLPVQLDLRTLTMPIAANIALPLPVDTAATRQTAGSGNVARNPDHYELNDVDELPRRTRYVPPRFPAVARRRGISGSVRVEFVVDAAGKVRNVRVISSTGQGVFDEPARRAVERWLFTPAIRQGKPVPVRCVVNVDFKLVD